MTLLLTIAGIGLVGAVLWDLIVTAALPNRVKGGLWFASFFHRSIWAAWSGVARHMHHGKWRETYLSLYGPLSMALLISTWACGLILGYALLHWMADSYGGSAEEATFFSSINKSASIFLPFGQGDTASRTTLARVLTVMQAGTTFACLATVMAYLLTLYKEFSRRKLRIALITSPDGLPQNAAKLLLRHSHNGSVKEIIDTLKDWEQWSAELLVGHRAHPFLGYFRSPKLSWLTAQILIMDSSAMLLSTTDHALALQAKHTFSMARRTVIDMARFFAISTQTPNDDRHLFTGLAQLRAVLAAASVPLHEAVTADEKLIVWQATYEPYVLALSDHLLMTLPVWEPSTRAFFRQRRQTPAN